MQISGLCIFINIFFSPHEVLQPFKVYNLQKLKQNTNKNISLTTFESQILINSSILPVAARVHPPLFLPVGTSKSQSWGQPQPGCWAVGTGPPATVRGRFGCTESPSGMTVWWTETWTHVTNQTHAGIRCAVRSKARPPYWVQGQDRRLVISAMLFPFCLAGSQEEQGLECEPFGGGLRPPLLGCFAGAGLAVLPSPGRWLRTYLVHRWLGSTWNSPLVGRVKATLL